MNYVCTNNTCLFVVGFFFSRWYWYSSIDFILRICNCDFEWRKEHLSKLKSRKCQIWLTACKTEISFAFDWTININTKVNHQDRRPELTEKKGICIKMHIHASFMSYTVYLLFALPRLYFFKISLPFGRLDWKRRFCCICREEPSCLVNHQSKMSRYLDLMKIWSRINATFFGIVREKSQSVCLVIFPTYHCRRFNTKHEKW